jgi:predicted O-linked N-acetylglucosamine transferase (SPINDLY family)
LHADKGLAAAAALLRAGQFTAAERCLLALVPASPDAAVWLHLGAAQHALGKYDQASASFARAIELAPASPQGYCAQATVLFLLGRAAEAEQVLRKAPDDAQVHFNLAVLLERRGQRAEARASYERALAREPGHVEARLNLGAIRLDAGDAQGALQDFDAVLARSASADAHANRARALLALLKDEDALAAADAALAIEPRHTRALLERVAALASLGRLEEAERSMPPAHEIAAELRARGLERPPSALDLYFVRAFDRQFACDWRDRGALIDRLREASAAITDCAMSFKALSLPLNGAEQRRLADSVANALPGGMDPYRSKAAGRPRARIGFLSANVAAHPEAYLLLRVLRELDRRSYEVRLYGLNAPDGGPLAMQLQRGADAFVDLSALTARQVVERLRAEDLDLLVETSGYLRGARAEVLKARVAPVQASYLSTPGTLGGGLVDYRVSDAWTTPREAQNEWAEKLVLLPPPHFAYDNEIRATPSGARAQHGLPDAAPVLCCMNQAFKIEPDAFGVWMRVLKAVPEAVLWLLDEGPLVQANLRREAQARGVAPGRLLFAPRVGLEQHLGRLAHADLFLDTFCCNAHTTALDALWAGVPVLTRRGGTMASRLASTFVRSAGMDELAVDTTEQYERLALELAGDPSSLRRLKGMLARRKASVPLFDTPARVRALERGLNAMLERHRAGLPPDTLIIE